jgi:chemotaxis protein CheC
MLSADQAGYVCELLNIAFGQAAAPLAALMGRFVVLSPPQVSTVRRAEAVSWLGERFGSGSQVHVVQQAFQPDLRGEAILVMRAERGAHAWGLFADPQHEPTEAEEKDATLEIGNLLVGACIGHLAAQLGTSVRYRPPRLALFARPLHELDVPQAPDAELLVIHTRFSVEDTRFESCLFLVLSHESMAWLRRTLDQMLDAFFADDNEGLGMVL